MNLNSIITGPARLGLSIGRKAIGLVRNRFGGGEVDDQTLQRDVEAEVFRSRRIARRTVELEVVDGVVWIRGEVKSATIVDEAEELAAGIPGVTRVENLLRVAKAKPRARTARGAGARGAKAKPAAKAKPKPASATAKPAAKPKPASAKPAAKAKPAARAAKPAAAKPAAAKAQPPVAEPAPAAKPEPTPERTPTAEPTPAGGAAPPSAEPARPAGMTPSAEPTRVGGAERPTGPARTAWETPRPDPTPASEPTPAGGAAPPSGEPARPAPPAPTPGGFGSGEERPVRRFSPSETPVESEPTPEEHAETGQGRRPAPLGAEEPVGATGAPGRGGSPPAPFPETEDGNGEGSAS